MFSNTYTNTHTYMHAHTMNTPTLQSHYLPLPSTTKSQFIFIILCNHIQNLTDAPTRITICCLQEMQFSYKGIIRLQVKVWGKIYHVNTNRKKTSVAILISGKTVFWVKDTSSDKESHFIMITRSIHSRTQPL